MAKANLAAAMLEHVTHPQRPYGLLSTEDLQARIAAAAAQTTVLAVLTAEADYRRRLDTARQRGEDQARRDPAAPALARRRREQAQQQTEARRRSRDPGRTYRPPTPGITFKGPSQGYGR
ncbi:hypothetical protein FHR32_005001 [Streptosporangium album]|uniref:Uncharacterized protein n=1 Tax=Streptosporangium album TaxID=47479 RepID=A0A7W7RYK2_9ACTN|nr:hypothetical protein [Streptosporangium album]